MGLELLKNNIEKQSELALQLAQVNEQLFNLQDSYYVSDDEKKKHLLFINSINALFSQIDILNNALPELINSMATSRDLAKPRLTNS
jgi:cob(I)alamin adenosyltransferase